MSLGEWLVLALACVAGVGGLLLASYGEADTTYALGFILFIGAVIYVARFIKRHFDYIDQGRP